MSITHFTFENRKNACDNCITKSDTNVRYHTNTYLMETTTYLSCYSEVKQKTNTILMSSRKETTITSVSKRHNGQYQVY